MNKKNEVAVFGGGCFWCTEAVFERVKGIVSVMPGYAGGSLKDPGYYEVCEGTTGHAEVIKIEFDPSIISYQTLLDIFFDTHDPTTLNKQGNDTGTEYRSVIFYTTEEQKNQAEETIKKLENSKAFVRKIVTEIQPLDTFYNAESYHQKYYEKNSYQPYCSIVISPKIKHFEEKYASLLKK